MTLPDVADFARSVPGRRDGPPPGFRFVWKDETDGPGLEWRTVEGPKPKSCRWGASRGIPACGAPAVAELNRGTDRPRWWAYCAEHLFGRYLDAETGRFYHVAFEPIEEEVAADG